MSCWLPPQYIKVLNIGEQELLVDDLRLSPDSVQLHY